MLINQARQAEAQTPLNSGLSFGIRVCLKQKTPRRTHRCAGKGCCILANVSRSRATETTEVGRTVPFAYYKIRIHWRDDINEAMYLVYQGKELEINSIIDLQERHKYLELECTERVTPNG